MGRACTKSDASMPMKVGQARRRPMAHRMRRTAAAVLALALLSTACQVAAGQDETALRLDKVSLTVARAEELDRVRFDGVDEQADLSELELVLRTDQAGEFGLMLHRDAAGLYTTVPLHPDTPGRGGPRGAAADQR